MFLKLFKQIYKSYLSVAILGTIGFLFLSSSVVIMGKEVYPPKINPLLAILLWIIFVFADAFFFNRIAIKKINKVTAIMTEDCRVRDCINNYIDLLIKNGDRRTKKLLSSSASLKNRDRIIKTFLELNLSAGYLYLGDYISAKEVLDRINYFPDNRVGATYRIWLINNLVSYYLQIHDTEKAARQIDNFRKALENTKLDKTSRALYYQIYNVKEFLLNIQKGIFDGAEDCFCQMYQGAKQKISKVAAKYTLGEIYLHYKEFDKAANAFQFVLDNGGDSYFVRKATDFLDHINHAV